MAYLLSGLTALVIALLIARGFTSANPATIARQIRFLGGVLLVAIAAVLALRGRIDLALLIGFAGWGLLMGRGVLPWGSGGWGGGPSPNQGSRVATDHLEMELDHASGAIRGTILKGRFAGQDIETLSPADLVLIWQDYSFADPSSAQILEAYLDRRHPTWRDDLERQAEGEDGEDTDRSDQRGSRRSSAPRSSSMTRAEAFEILGLQDGASDDDIRSSHRELMKKLHPDRGGSNYLAAKINEAKALLVGD